MTLQIGIDRRTEDRSAVSLDAASIRRAVAAYVTAQTGEDFAASDVALFSRPATGDIGALALSRITPRAVPATAGAGRKEDAAQDGPVCSPRTPTRKDTQ